MLTQENVPAMISDLQDLLICLRWTKRNGHTLEYLICSTTENYFEVKVHFKLIFKTETHHHLCHLHFYHTKKSDSQHVQQQFSREFLKVLEQRMSCLKEWISHFKYQIFCQNHANCVFATNKMSFKLSQLKSTEKES